MTAGDLTLFDFGLDHASPRDRANSAQLEASDPAVSAFVGASAGSGKTKLLTDRLLRLMLAGAKPDRIQCLTFTKAAAAEMALRLQRTLGRWVTLAPDELAAELRRLQVEPTPEACSGARALFARVLDLPGGMRIGTIHAFCQSLLRRFPLEATLSPHFQLVDDRDAEDALTEAREDMLSKAHTDDMRSALARLAGLASLDRFGLHVATLNTDRKRLDAALALGSSLRPTQRRVLGVTARSESDLIETAVNWQDERPLREAAQAVSAAGSGGAQTRSQGILDWLSRPTRERAAGWAAWRSLFLTDAGNPRSDSAFVNAKVARDQSQLLPRFTAEAERIIAMEDARRALAVSEVSAALVTLAAPVLRAYATRKEEGSLLDYDDLIGRTSALLIDPGAAWVLYKLDGGLDHLLLDEVQDTAPAQWNIAHALTEEFFAGTTAREETRTVFAVGDRKQSIYSFQGADTEEFDRSRERLRARVEASRLPWRDIGLDVSFRSTRPVLELVDKVFADPQAREGVVPDGEVLTHYADRGAHAGRVELWPLAPLPELVKPEPWQVPEQNQGLTSAPQLLADALAVTIAQQTSGRVLLESQGRPLAPGDVMVLVRRRNAFAYALVRALKSRGVPVAGLDRLVLTEPAAVQDLLALADALLLPQDDLAFACFLTSPLGGLTDDDLMALAVGRTGPLWDALRSRAAEHPHWSQAWGFFSSLLSLVDYLSPYALLAEALGPLGGRARLFARLGPEAAEPIDELLHAALTYGRLHPPSLQGFLHWLRRSGAEVKREADSGAGLVRVMTVHGAKGLQAPLVILPDTTALPPEDNAILWADDPRTGVQVPIWVPRREFQCSASARIRDEGRRQRTQEHNRLLYVALTRAEDRLIVCGWQSKRALPDTCWYSHVARGFAALEAAREAFPHWDGEILSIATTQRYRSPQSDRSPATPLPPMPPWLGRAPDWRASLPPPEPARPVALAPSRPDGVELGPVPGAASPLADRGARDDRFARGKLIHALLQHLPALPEHERQDAAYRWLNRPGVEIGSESVPALVSEVLAVMSDPRLAPLFGPASRAEVPLTGVVGNAVVGGLVDRLAVLPDEVLVADFKTNRNPPQSADETPLLYLRQMASYRAVLRAIFPDRPIRCALIWTRTAEIAILPDRLLDPHDPGCLDQDSHAVPAA
jgi:ATP-dependent helicase/nuclease subunit A